MSLTPIRESILDYLVNTTLPLIDGTGNYNNDLVTITRALKQPHEFEAHELPAVVIRDDLPVNYQPMTAAEYETGTGIGDLNDGMMVALIGISTIGHTPLDKTGLVSQAANKMLTDLIQAMLSDITLGGNCEAVTLVRSHNSVDWAENDGMAVTFHVYSINYTFNPSTPTI